jgi:murein L,D-transpeptidase YcbB/YkuD
VKVNLLFRSVHHIGFVLFVLFQSTLAYALPIDINQTATKYIDSYHWFQNHHTRAMAKEGLNFIADSAKHGLKPDDYNYQTLVTLSSATNSHQQAEFNRLFIEGLLRLTHDLRIGRWIPLMVDPDWHIPQAKFDEKTFLSHALDSGQLKNHLDLLAPSTSDYLQLVEAYARYQRYAQHGGWGTIPATPKLYPGDYHSAISLIQSRLAVEDAFFAYTDAVPSNLYDPLMEEAIRHFQKRSSLKVDGIIGRNTLRALNIPVTARLSQLEVNMERHRWMPRELGERHILINLANYRLQAFEQGQERLAMNVVVGSKERQTPSFSAQMSHMVFNPYWNVPSKLARLDLLPKQQHDPNYFSQQFRYRNRPQGRV